MMDPLRWQRIQSICAAVAALAADEREAYLCRTCAGDEELRREVESFLSCARDDKPFLESPAIQQAARGLAEARIAGRRIDLTGQTLLHYRIIGKIGTGGMGEVYKAHDTHLDRLVAIKVLPPDRVADPDRKSRFVREAKAASALNHPNIVTIHDISEAGGVNFIAMECVEGKTLDALIGREGLRFHETLKYAIQIAGALAKAHGAGIVHRDLKPSNIMVTGDGLVKLLDFGLAKLTEPLEGERLSETRSASDTREGMILGTAAYMSPEQAEGKPVDARSDIFSFGALLYEMVTGRRAFQRSSQASTIAAILGEDPQPVSQISAQTPPDLEKIISRSLRKDPAQRFQHAADLRVALAELEEESVPGAPVRAKPWRWRRTLLWAAGTLALTLALGSAVWFRYLRSSPAGASVVSAMAARPGLEWDPALSPDGKQVAFVWNGETEDNFDIYVQLVGEATPRRLTTDPAYDFSPVWSPDALQIAFVRERPDGIEVRVIPTAGGPERRLSAAAAGTLNPIMRNLARQLCGLAWSPNGKFLAMVDKESPRAPNSIFLLDLKTREKRKITTPPSGWYGDGLSVFSPDGRTLAFARMRMTGLTDIYALPISESGEPRGEPRQLTNDSSSISGMDWSCDGRSIVFASTRGGVLGGLWRMASSGGERERLIGSPNSMWPSVSRTGERLAYAEVTVIANLWAVASPGGDTGGPAPPPKRLTQWLQFDQNPAFSRDGKRIAWASPHSGSLQLWVCSSDGSGAAPLTRFEASQDAHYPQWSPDGRQIVFTIVGRGGLFHLYVIDADGGVPRRLTTGDFPEWRPSWSRDGKWVYFLSNRGQPRAVWKVPAGGGSPLLVVRNPQVSLRSLVRSAVFESFDGKLIYFSGASDGIWKMPVGGGEATLVLKIGERAHWNLSQSGIHVLDPDAEGGPALEFFPFATGKRKEILRLGGKPDSYFFVSGGLAVSPDGRWVLYQYLDRAESDIMLVENFR